MSRTDLGNVNIVNEDATLEGLQNSKQNRGQRGLWKRFFLKRKMKFNTKGINVINLAGLVRGLAIDIQ